MATASSKAKKRPKKKPIRWNGAERRNNSDILVALDEVKNGIGKVDIKQDAMNDKLIRFETQIFDPQTGILNTVKDHDKAIYGNGKPGVLKDIECVSSKIDVLEEKQNGRWGQILLTASLVLVFGSVLAFVISHFNILN